jgi:hypothetical protein
MIEVVLVISEAFLEILSNLSRPTSLLTNETVFAPNTEKLLFNALLSLLKLLVVQSKACYPVKAFSLCRTILNPLGHKFC